MRFYVFYAPKGLQFLAFLGEFWCNNLYFDYLLHKKIFSASIFLNFHGFVNTHIGTRKYKLHSNQQSRIWYSPLEIMDRSSWSSAADKIHIISTSKDATNMKFVRQPTLHFVIGVVNRLCLWGTDIFRSRRETDDEFNEWFASNSSQIWYQSK
jgi:hypothetical protein